VNIKSPSREHDKVKCKCPRCCKYHWVRMRKQKIMPRIYCDDCAYTVSITTVMPTYEINTRGRGRGGR